MKPKTILLRKNPNTARTSTAFCDDSLLCSSDEDREEPMKRRAALALAAQNQSHPPIQMIKADSSIVPPKSSTSGWMTPANDGGSLSESESSIDLHTPLPCV